MRVGLGGRGWDDWRQSVIAPDFHDVGDQFGLLIKIFPRRFATIVRIMLERHEGEILKAVVRSHIVEKPTQPRGTTLRIGPGLDVFSDSLKIGAPQFEACVNAMKSFCEL